MIYAQVILCQKSGGFNTLLTYTVPQELRENCQIGSFVQVPLKKQWVRGIVVKLEEGEGVHDSRPLKPIQGLSDEISIPVFQVELAFEMAAYYFTSLGKVLRMMLPKRVWEGKFKPPQRIFYRWKDSPVLVRGKKQQRLLDYLKRGGEWVEKRQLLRQLGPLSSSTLNGLLEKGVLEVKEIQEIAFHEPLKLKEPFEHQLNAAQEQALNRIRATDQPVLLHGVTGSGKTEIYLRFILEMIQQGKQALLLVPEIALAPQMIDYFKVHLGEALAVFHSRLSEGERALNWYRVRVGQARLVIGSRSACFAPALNWGCMIMDEEHEWTYKQESTPYYETHFVLDYLQKKNSIKLLFGSATPRLESFYKARKGEYDYLVLPERWGQMPLPQLQLVDLRGEFKERHFSIFSRALLRAMEEALRAGHQVMLFVNQRGTARAVVCRDCGYSATCEHCEVRLTFHSDAGRPRLICHYCGRVYPVPDRCPDCDSIYIKHLGVGTERVEAECRKFFPKAPVLRADQDSTRLKEGFLPIYQAFKQGRAQILVGTQMISKGLHFEKVTLIGVILADIGLNVPDFRAQERAFQLLTQMAGRGGRGEIPGKVIVQTYQPEHFVFQQAKAMDYVGFADHELALRQKHGYPPFGKLIKFIVVGPDSVSLLKALELEKKRLEEHIAQHQLGLTVSLAPALISKLSNQYYFHLLLQGENPHALFTYWQPPLGWRIDVDPVRMG